MIKKLIYCKNCVTPNTRPTSDFNKNGICNACINASEKKKINWAARLKELKRILGKYKKLSKNQNYNCIVPVSGGKDSIYQTYIIKKKFNMKPLAISWKPLSRTFRGEENLLALKKIGVDHIDFSPNPNVINNITKKSFFKFGDSSYIDHLCIYNLIPNLAYNLKIPLVIWGENQFFEYGGKKFSKRKTQDMDVVRKNNILKNYPAEKWISKSIKKHDIISFKSPNNKLLSKIKYKPIFLGYFLNWDIKRNKAISKKLGFKERISGPIMGLYKESDLDCTNIPIHHYFKWLKFGFNRVTDNCSNEIRKKRMTRAKAISLVKKFDGVKPPKEYINAFCKQININEKTFWKIANKFRNPNIWKQNKMKKWYLENWIGGEKKIDNFPFTKLSKEEINQLKIKL